MLVGCPYDMIHPFSSLFIISKFVLQNLVLQSCARFRQLGICLPGLGRQRIVRCLWPIPNVSRVGCSVLASSAVIVATRGSLNEFGQGNDFGEADEITTHAGLENPEDCPDGLADFVYRAFIECVHLLQIRNESVHLCDPGAQLRLLGLEARNQALDLVKTALAAGTGLGLRYNENFTATHGEDIESAAEVKMKGVTK